jgi:hypothetical protein
MDVGNNPKLRALRSAGLTAKWAPATFLFPIDRDIVCEEETDSSLTGAVCFTFRENQALFTPCARQEK